MWTRRDFLRTAVAGLGLALLNPSLAFGESSGRDPVLVALHLTGGNDALNTLVPYTDKLYHQARPNLALSTKKLLTIDKQMALHPSLARLANRYEQGQVLMVPGVGRPDHDRSHFRASDVWHGAGKPEGDGWMGVLGKRLDSTPVSFGSTVSQAVACPGHPAIGVLGKGMPEFPGSEALQKAWSGMYREWQGRGALAQRVRRSAEVVDQLTGELQTRMARLSLRQGFNGDDFGRRFELATRLLGAGFPARILHLSAGSFDTHEAQLDTHANQLKELDHALDAFLANMKALDRQVVVLVYSEFGRRVAENYSGGTDHGAGGLAWIAGDGIKGGLANDDYRLHDLRDGDLSHSVDYRQLYATVVEATFGASHREALFGRYVKPLKGA